MCIRDSSETDSAFTITVMDDGIGFDILNPPTDNRVHIGISNVRTRLAAQSNGSLEIKSLPHHGTTVTITIPKMCIRDRNKGGQTLRVS